LGVSIAIASKLKKGSNEWETKEGVGSSREELETRRESESREESRNRSKEAWALKFQATKRTAQPCGGCEIAFVSRVVLMSWTLGCLWKLSYYPMARSRPIKYWCV
jgi:hypothetical protein